MKSANKTNRSRGETAAKILLYDVESSPNIAYIWGKYEQDALGDFISERQIISFAWKWLGEKKVNVLALPDFPVYKKNPENNRCLILKLHELFGKADIVVGHNVEEFDDKMANTGFIKNGLQPPPPHKTADTLKIARAKFRFNSNKLDALGAFLGLGRKFKHGGFDLWVRCLKGEPGAWATMKRYNARDVTLLEKVYLKLRPWSASHPDVNAIDAHAGCPICRCKDLARKGWAMSGGGRRQRFLCLNPKCGKWSAGSFVRMEWKFR